MKSLFRAIPVFAAVSLSVAAVAQIARVPQGHLMPVTEKGRSVFAVAAAPAYRDGTVGQFVPLNAAVDQDAPSWQMVWDSMNTNPASLAAYSGTPYGTASPGPRRLDSDDYRRWMWLEDLKVAPGTEGSIAQFIRIGMFLNPAGTKPASGTSSLFLRVSTVTNFDTTTFGPAFEDVLGSVVLSYPNLAAGNTYPAATLSGTNLGLPIPYANGGLLVEVGTIGTGNVFKPLELPFSVQPLLSNMLSPGEPVIAGTNPSSSTEFQWYDDTNLFFIAANWPNYSFEDFTNTAGTSNTYAEFYTWDSSFLGQNYGILQAAATLFRDSNARTISGRVTLQGISANGAMPDYAVVKLIDPGTGQVISTANAAIGPLGEYRVLDPNQGAGGQYRVQVKTAHWLQSGANASTTAGSATNVNVFLENGDCNGDNYIGTDDYLVLNAAFDTAAGEPAFDERADLDVTGYVGTDDYLILSFNFDRSGE